MLQLLLKSPQAKCFCAPACYLCPGRIKCQVYSEANARHARFSVKLMQRLYEDCEPSRELLWVK